MIMPDAMTTPFHTPGPGGWVGANSMAQSFLPQNLRSQGAEFSPGSKTEKASASELGSYTAGAAAGLEPHTGWIPVEAKEGKQQGPSTSSQSEEGQTEQPERR